MSKQPLDEPQDVGVAESRCTLTIEALAAGGRGIARREGLVWFVPGTVPGDVVVAQATRRRPRFVDARLVRIANPSPDRRPPPCPHQPRCGGCPWMGIDEARQREWKLRLVREALARIGRLAVSPIEPIRAPVPHLGYRNRVEFTVRSRPGRAPVLGLHRLGAPGQITEIDRCLLQRDPADRVLQRIRRILSDCGPAGRSGGELRVALRSSGLSGRVLVALRGDGAPRDWVARLAAGLVRPRGEVVGVVRLRGRGGATRSDVLAGGGSIDERIAGLEFRIPAASFIQVSVAGAEALVGLVTECAEPADGLRVLDLYGGIGICGIHLRRRGVGEVTVCDVDRRAVDCGRRAARGAGVGGVAFVRADTAAFLGTVSGAVDLVLANPPRAGLDAEVVERLVALAPGRIVLVSCDPATLARDLRRLSSRGGYRVSRVVPLDLFPQTAHVETVVRLDATEARSGQT